MICTHMHIIQRHYPGGSKWAPGVSKSSFQRPLTVQSVYPHESDCFTVNASLCFDHADETHVFCRSMCGFERIINKYVPSGLFV